MGNFLIENKFLLDHLEEGVYFVDLDRTITYWNEAAERITGFTKENVLGKHCWDNILKHVDITGKELCLSGCPLKATCDDGRVRSVEIFLHHKKGHRVPVAVKAIPILDSMNNINGAIEVFSSNADEDYYKKLKELEKIAMTDTLTGIANRLYTDKFLAEKVEIYKVNGRSFGVAFLDIDHFKQINDVYGHDAGDEVLKTVANTLSANLRGTDLIGRWGGEEFIIYLEKVSSESLVQILEKLRMLVAASQIKIGNNNISVTVSMGGVIIKDGDSKENIIKRADELMYRSKKEGRNRVSI